MVVEVQTGKFKPDATRSGYLSEAAVAAHNAAEVEYEDSEEGETDIASSEGLPVSLRRTAEEKGESEGTSRTASEGSSAERVTKVLERDLLRTALNSEA
eukprot:480747-Amphidinium_carterae.1